MEHSLITEIEMAAASMGIQPSTLLLRVINDGKAYRRLQAGGTVTLATARKIQNFIAESAHVNAAGLRHD